MFNNVLGLQPGTLGKDILENGKLQLSKLYPKVVQINNEKVCGLKKLTQGFEIITNKNTYHTEQAVIAVGYTNLITIKGLENYIEPHPRAAIEKDRIWLKKHKSFSR